MLLEPILANGFPKRVTGRTPKTPPEAPKPPPRCPKTPPRRPKAPRDPPGTSPGTPPPDPKMIEFASMLGQCFVVPSHRPEGAGAGGGSPPPPVPGPHRGGTLSKPPGRHFIQTTLPPGKRGKGWGKGVGRGGWGEEDEGGGGGSWISRRSRIFLVPEAIFY